MRTDELDFELPPELIAQHPPAVRGESRLMHYCRRSQATSHKRFVDLPSLLRPGDVLVFNDARVTPAKFTLIKPTGGRVGGLFLEQVQPGEWVALLKSLGPVRPDAVHTFTRGQASARILEKLGGGKYRLKIEPNDTAEAILSVAGEMPLPPYIKRESEVTADRERYQTVYAATPGSVAAPTAGLHFTPETLAALDVEGIERVALTLHVGIGTFRPVAVEDLDEHDMHAERYSLPANACETINRAKREGRRIIAVGTTAARVLESQPPGEICEKSGETRLFIRPGYAYRHVDALLTNFHLPRSTLIALVAAFVGLEEQRRLYREAIEQRYRFFSYGDCMFLEGNDPRREG